jgi:hypothetical protein
MKQPGTGSGGAVVRFDVCQTPHVNGMREYALPVFICLRG